MTKREAIEVTVRAIMLSRTAAAAGQIEAAKEAWLAACRTAYHCGGFSGTLKGDTVILIERDDKDYVAYAPVELTR